MLFFKRNPNNNLQKEILTSRNSIISYIQDFLYKCFCPPCKNVSVPPVKKMLNQCSVIYLEHWTSVFLNKPSHVWVQWRIQEFVRGGESTRTFQRDLAPKNAWSPLEISVNSFSGVEALPTYPAPVFGPGLVLLHGSPCTREYQSNTTFFIETVDVFSSNPP